MTERKPRLLTHDGRTLRVSEWARETGLSVELICARIDDLGWPIEDALTMPAGSKQITYNGRTQTVAAWAAEVGLSYNTLWRRLTNGVPVERALTAPSRIRNAAERAQEQSGVRGEGDETDRRQMLTHDGRTQTVAEWARETGLSEITIRSRLAKYGWPVDRALTTPAVRGRPTATPRRSGGG